MSHDEDRDYRTVFDVRQVNLIKIDKLIDLEIVLAECDHAIAGIKRQIEDGYGDHHWLADARRAIGEIEHKKRLAAMKQEAVTTAKTKQDTIQSHATPEQNFKSRFVKAAEKFLAPDLYAEIAALAAYRPDTIIPKGAT